MINLKLEMLTLQCVRYLLVEYQTVRNKTSAQLFKALLAERAC